MRQGTLLGFVLEPGRGRGGRGFQSFGLVVHVNILRSQTYERPES